MISDRSGANVSRRGGSVWSENGLLGMRLMSGRAQAAYFGKPERFFAGALSSTTTGTHPAFFAIKHRIDEVICKGARHGQPGGGPAVSHGRLARPPWLAGCRVAGSRPAWLAKWGPSSTSSGQVLLAFRTSSVAQGTRNSPFKIGDCSQTTGPWLCGKYIAGNQQFVAGADSWVESPR